MKFLKLHDYLDMSFKFLLKTGNPCIFNNEDNISDVAYLMMKADEKYNPDVKKLTQEQFRYLYASYAIRNIVREFRKQETVLSLDSEAMFNYVEVLCGDDENDVEFDLHRADIVEKLKNCKTISSQQKNCIFLYFMKDMTYEEVGKKIGVSHETVRKIINRTLEQLKGEFQDYADSPFQ